MTYVCPQDSARLCLFTRLYLVTMLYLFKRLFLLARLYLITVLYPFTRLYLFTRIYLFIRLFLFTGFRLPKKLHFDTRCNLSTRFHFATTEARFVHKASAGPQVTVPPQGALVTSTPFPQDHGFTCPQDPFAKEARQVGVLRKDPVPKDLATM